MYRWGSSLPVFHEAFPEGSIDVKTYGKVLA